MDLALQLALDERLEEVRLAHGRAARREHDICLCEAAAECVCEGIGAAAEEKSSEGQFMLDPNVPSEIKVRRQDSLVPEDTEVHDLQPEPADRSFQTWAVRVIDLEPPWFLGLLSHILGCRASLSGGAARALPLLG